MTLYTKAPTSIDDQANLLIQRGIVCADINAMKRHLKQIGYYRLGAYWLPFELPPAQGQVRSKRFPVGTDFADIITIYQFDRDLRMMIMEAIERIEVVARSNWVTELTLSTNAHPHINSAWFRSQREHAGLLAQLYRSVDQNKEKFIRYYKTKYTAPDIPPLWAVAETMSFGGLSKWVTATKNNAVKKRVAISMGLPNSAQLEGVLEALTYVRNICAHHNRLWNRRLVKRMPNIRRFQSSFERTAHNGQLQPDNLIYNVLVVILHICLHLNVDPTYKQRLKMLVGNVTDAQRSAMGFPADWETRPAWA